VNSGRRTLTITAAALGIAAAVTSLHPSVNLSQLATEIDKQQDHISATDLGERLMRGDTVRIFDLRSSAEFEMVHLPGAFQTNLAQLASMSTPQNDTIILYSAGGAHAAQAWMLLRMRGYRRVYFLREGLYEWNSLVLNPRLAADATAAERMQFERAQVLSRFFGGEAKTNVSRADLPKGYWTGTSNEGTDQAGVQLSESAAGVRRRGC
jgi:rhodanese-related sulfurtransferase